MELQPGNRPSPGIGEPGLPGAPETGLGDIRPKKKVRRRKYTDKQECDYVTLYKKSGQLRRRVFPRASSSEVSSMEAC